MYRLYWASGTASLGPQIVLEECGLHYEIVPVDIAAAENRKPTYLKINPHGKVPALVFPDGEVMTESAAIMLHLADANPTCNLAPLMDDPARKQFLRHYFYLTNTMHGEYRHFFYPARYSTDANHAPNIKDQSINNLLASWKPVDDHLRENGPYHLGNTISLVDIYMLMVATWFESVGDLFTPYPSIKHCFDLVAQRPAVSRCLDQHESVTVAAD